MKNFCITSQQFIEYLESLGLFRLRLSVNELGAEAVVNSVPNLADFTSVSRLAGGFYSVRLSGVDYLNAEITGGYFTGAAVDQLIKAFVDEGAEKLGLTSRYAFAERWIEERTYDPRIRSRFLNRFKIEVLDKV